MVREIFANCPADACQLLGESIAYLHPEPFIWCGEAKDVLVLSRKVGERILIGDKIAVTVVKIGHGGVRIGIEAPPEMAVVRQELADALVRAEKALASEQAEIAE